MAERICPVEGCDKPRGPRRMCRGHYERSRRGSVNTGPVRPCKGRRPCSFDGCDRPHAAHGLCRGHYGQQWAGKPLVPLHDFANRRKCSFDGCDRRQSAKGLCKAHHAMRLGGRELAPIKPKHATAGDTFVSAEGYVQVHVPGHPSHNGWPKEHRWIMEQELGRPLLRTESVHHVNGVRADNSRSNLELWVSSQPSGQRPVDLVVWAREIIDLYGALVDC